LEQLPRVVPVFPLPGFVLFPRVLVPLHVFELRYRTMVRDALSRDRLIAVALLQPGYEADYFGSPTFHDLGCLARIEDVEWLPNDRYDLRVLGAVRVRLGGVVREFPYRSVRAETLSQHPYSEDDPLVQIEKRALLELFQRLARAMREVAGEEVASALPQLAAEDDYERIVNTLCMACGGSDAHRLALLQEDSVIERGRAVRERVERSLSVRAAAPDPGGPGGERN
jgi:uncharacterized protein